jgi:hypothetical protein
MRIDSVFSGGGLVVDNGVDITIPGEGIELQPSKRPCRITVILRGVYYDGDNIGSDWKYEVSVNGGVWVTPVHTVQWKTWDVVNEKIYEEVVENACQMMTVVCFFIRARERDGYCFDDIGKRAEVTVMPCEEKPTPRRLIIGVSVPEYSFFKWLRILLRKYQQSALLYFVFEIETQCV